MAMESRAIAGGLSADHQLPGDLLLCMAQDIGSSQATVCHPRAPAQPHHPSCTGCASVVTEQLGHLSNTRVGFPTLTYIQHPAVPATPQLCHSQHGHTTACCTLVCSSCGAARPCLSICCCSCCCPHPAAAGCASPQEEGPDQTSPLAPICSSSHSSRMVQRWFPAVNPIFGRIMRPRHRCHTHRAACALPMQQEAMLLAQSWHTAVCARDRRASSCWM
jgi:hypothetical protein